jgi:hypothetical protein
MTSLRRALGLLAPLALVVAGCSHGGPGDTHDDRHALSVVLEGESIRDELQLSPVREAPAPFVRLGLMWDAPAGSVLEARTSADGAGWSEWRPVTVHAADGEGILGHVGELVVEGGEAFHYQLRAGGVLPSFLVIEFIEHRRADMAEVGGVAVAEPGIGSTRQALSYGGVAVNPRSTWNARAPKCTSAHSPYRITLHHTVTPTNDSMTPEQRLRQIQNYHMDVNGWCDIGYHFLVSRDGRLWEGRPAGRLGTHVGNNNTGNVGISVIGTYTTDTATATQIDQIAALMRGVAQTYGIPIDDTRIKGHRDYNATACPGNALYPQLPTIIAKAKDGGATLGTTVKGVIYRGTDTSDRIGGATVTLGGKTTTASASGVYEFRDVPAGTYTITATAPGYQPGSVTRSVSGGETWGSIGLTPEGQPVPEKPLWERIGGHAVKSRF